jgi:hypothetical protein
LFIKKIFRIANKKESAKISSWVVVFIIWDNELVDKKPPVEISVIERFRLLNNLILDAEKRTNIKIVKDKYKKKILYKIFLILISRLRLLLLEYTKLFNLY